MTTTAFPITWVAPMPYPEPRFVYGRPSCFLSRPRLDSAPSKVGLVALSSDDGRPEPAHEVYLRLVEVDLDDTDAIVTFIRIYGPLRLTWRYPRGRGVLGDWPHNQGEVELLDVLEGFQAGARYIRDLLAAVRFVLEGIVPSRWESRWATHDACPLPEPDVLRDLIERQARPTPIATAYWSGDEDRLYSVLSFVRSGLSTGLRPFHPDLSIAPNPELAPSDRRMEYGEQVDFGEDFHRDMYRPTTLEICCLQLYNHIHERASIRECIHCGSLFVRQRGTAEHGQHRLSGVKYCKAACRNAANVRAHRQRRRTID